MDRAAIVEALEELALLSELLGDNPFKVRAYAGAARALHKATPHESTWAEAGVLERIPGIGKGTAERVRELMASGRLAELEEVRSRVPKGVREILGVHGLGPKKVAVLWKDLGVTTLGELEYACLENRLTTLGGFGAKTQDKVLAGVRFRAGQRGRLLLPAALAVQVTLSEKIASAAPDGACFWTGEAVRLCPTVDGFGVVVAGRQRAAEIASRLGLRLEEGDRLEGRLPEGWRLSVRGVEPDALGASLVWENSSEAFREALRQRASERGWAWGAPGLTRRDERASTPTEAAFWEAVGLEPIPPECREDPAALDADLSQLIGEGDIRGAFHVHTDWSDGGAALEEMVRAAEALGWQYIGICDHSASAVYANGLSAERLAAQREAIAEVQKKHPAIRIFAGVESDILGDGSLDYADAALAPLDLVVASVHSRFALDEEAQTARLVRAAGHPATTFMGHPTGRLLLAREPYRFRWEELVAAAASGGAAMELNANPHRLDVDWTRLADLRQAGVPIGIHPDAHSVEGLRDVRFGVWAARKGLARKADVLNALDSDEISAHLRARKEGRR